MAHSKPPNVVASTPRFLKGRVVTDVVVDHVAPWHCQTSRCYPLSERSSHPRTSCTKATLPDDVGDPSPPHKFTLSSTLGKVRTPPYTASYLGVAAASPTETNTGTCLSFPLKRRGSRTSICLSARLILRRRRAYVCVSIIVVDC